MNSFICLLACVLLYFLIIRGIITHNNKIIIYSIITYDIFYDYIFIDCPPSLGTLTVNALTASHSVLIPIQCEYYALEGLSQMTETISMVKDALNPDLTIEGILFTMYDSRNLLSQEVVKAVQEHFSDPIFKTIIPRNVRLAEAPSHGLPISLYDNSSTGAEAYRKLAAEILEKDIAY